MQPHQDAYGQAMYDYLAKGEGFEIIERDDGFFDVSAGPPRYFAAFEDWPPHEQQAMAYVRGRVLDVGSGAGRVSLYLQESGHTVVAIDNSPLALDVCRRRGVRDARLVPITQVSTRLGIFDSVVMLGNNFGLFANARRARWLLRRFHRLISPGGRIIAETNDITQTEDPDHLAYHQRNRARGRLPGQIRLRVRYRHKVTPWFDYLMVSKPELEAILEGTGWRAVHYLDPEGPIYIAILEKA